MLDRTKCIIFLCLHGDKALQHIETIPIWLQPEFWPTSDVPSLVVHRHGPQQSII